MASEVESLSPVTWHVALWVLLSLAINSMSQPAGKIFGFPARFRIYLSSSPIVCCADALSVLLEWVTTAIYLRVSPFTAAMFVRGRRLGHESPNYNVQRHSTWPRWLFFIIGVLPAAIKLVSFSGTPWTQVWGMIFLGSFAIIELVSVIGDAEASNSPSLSREAIDLPEAIEYRDQKVHLNNSFELFELFLFVVAILCHIVLGIKIYWSLWVPFYHEIEESPLAQAITVYANIVIYVPLITTWSPPRWLL